MPTISHADTTHLPAILDIYNDAIAHTTAVWINNMVDLENREQWLLSRKKEGFPVLVLMEGQQLLGYASYGPFRAFEGYKYTAELSVYVAAHARGKGAGSRLMQALLEHAYGNNIHVLLGAVEAQNTASVRLHEKYGFTQAGLLPQVGRKFGRWLDLILMQRIL
ncbi:GNAT family N-acetyltransferase [Pseudochrobactrum sp. HB0163]|uniref:GNAT family N-acetyltransferase n=1 Tax=Pseudochrobactrum sp. HB0163 TaxID=3450708 RepID=UPI003F6E346C